MKSQLVVLSLAALFASSSVYGGGHSFRNSDFKAELSGAEEVPPVDTSASGEAKFKVNDDETEIEFELEFEDGTGMLGVAGSHIHCAPMGENGPVVVFLAGQIPPAGFDDKYELKATITGNNILNPDCGTTLSELIQSMRDGQTYVNVHSVSNPGGEIRGQIFED